MAFVFSVWYIVLALLLLAVAGCVVAFVLMDKKDKALINDFLKHAAAESAEANEEKQELTKEEGKQE